jgi:hypothetical protein
VSAQGGEDHNNQMGIAGGPSGIVDLWQNHGPAFGQNGTYSAELYGGHAVALIDGWAARAKANASAKMFMYLPWHDTHDPLEAPQSYFYPPHFADSFKARMTYRLRIIMITIRFLDWLRFTTPTLCDTDTDAYDAACTGTTRWRGLWTRAWATSQLR